MATRKHAFLQLVQTELLLRNKTTPGASKADRDAAMLAMEGAWMIPEETIPRGALARAASEYVAYMVGERSIFGYPAEMPAWLAEHQENLKSATGAIGAEPSWGE